MSGGKGVSVDSSNDTLEMDGSGITGASALDGAAVDNDGQFWATNSSFTDNKATDDGGAIYDSLGSMRLRWGHIRRATRPPSAGGAIYQPNGPAAIDNSTFSTNTASDPSGAATGGAIVAGDEMELTERHLHGEFCRVTKTAYGRDERLRCGLRQVRADLRRRQHVHRQHGLRVTTPGSEGGAFDDDSGTTISSTTSPPTR